MQGIMAGIEVGEGGMHTGVWWACRRWEGKVYMLYGQRNVWHGIEKSVGKAVVLLEWRYIGWYVTWKSHGQKAGTLQRKSVALVMVVCVCVCGQRRVWQWYVVWRCVRVKGGSAGRCDGRWVAGRQAEEGGRHKGVCAEAGMPCMVQRRQAKHSSKRRRVVRKVCSARYGHVARFSEKEIMRRGTKRSAACSTKRMQWYESRIQAKRMSTKHYHAHAIVVRYSQRMLNMTTGNVMARPMAGICQ